MQTKLQDSGPLQNALSALHNAEDQLRDATAKAASVGAYDDVVMITRWARALQILLEEANSPKGNGAIPENIADQPVRETVANGSNQLAAETSGRRKLWRTPIYTR